MLVCWLVMFATEVSAQCGAKNTAFLPGERISYNLMFNWKFIWIKVGTAELTTDKTEYEGKPGYCFRLKSHTSKRADFFFKMRDTLTCYVTDRLEPLYFCKAAEEGKRHTRDEAWFSYSNGVSHVKQRRTWYSEVRAPQEMEYTAESGCIFDMLSILGQARSWNPADFKVGDKVSLEVASKKHADTCKNHSATHLLQKALKTVLGDHVEQKGSLVTPDRLRFDFSHFEAMTPEEIEKVEAIVNQEIQAALPVVTDVMSIEEAKKTGAMALFDEKYEEKVRVVSMGDFSKELCGGTHVSNTSQILVFKIVSEAGIAAGVRRIEALTGDGVFAYYKEIERQLHQAAKTAKTTPAGLNEKIEHLQAEIRELHSENESLKSKMAKDALGDVMDQVQEIGGVKVLAARVDGVDMNGLRDLGDQLKEKLGEGVVVLASAVDGKVSLMATATDGAQKKGAHAGNLIKAIAGLVGGGGGGRPGMAQAGGKNPDGIDAAIAKAAEVAAEQLGQ